MTTALRYAKGDIIAFWLGAEIREDEIAWIRNDGGIPYYHTSGDEKLGDGYVIGRVMPDGRREPNPGFLTAFEREVETMKKTFEDKLAAVRKWSS